MSNLLPKLIFMAGISQWCILIASAMVPFHLNWRQAFAALPSRLHRQLYWVYGGYVVLSIVAFGCLSILNARELAGGSALARGVCIYIAIFWGIRLCLQGVLDVGEHLTTGWLKLGYGVLTVLFICLTLLYGWAALYPVQSG